MEVAFSRASFFKRFVRSFDRVVPEFLFACDKDGIRYAGMDATQVAIVAFQLGPDVFHRYICKPPNSQSEVLLGLSQQLLSQFLQVMPDDCLLVMQDAGDRLRLFADGGAANGAEYKSDMKILELHREFHELPSDDLYRVRIDFPSKQFAMCIRDLANIGSDQVTMRVDPAPRPAKDPTQRESNLLQSAQGEPDSLDLFPEDEETVREQEAAAERPRGKLTLEGKSATGSVVTTFISGECGFNEWDASAKLEQSFPLNFLRDHTMKFSSLCSTVRVSLGGSHVPLELKFPLRASPEETTSEDEAEDADDVEAPHLKAARIRREGRKGKGGGRRDDPGAALSFVAFYLGSLLRPAEDEESAAANTEEEENTQSVGINDDDMEMR